MEIKTRLVIMRSERVENYLFDRHLLCSSSITSDSAIKCFDVWNNEMK